jgi:hypothetical protein
MNINMRKPLIAKITLLAGLAVSACSDKSNPTNQKEMRPTASSPTIQSKASAAAEEARKPEETKAWQTCSDSVKAKESAYKKNVASGDYWGAAQSLRICANLLQNAELLNLVKDAEVKSYLSDIKNPKKSAEDKKLALELLGRDHPDEYNKHKAKIDEVIAAENKRAEIIEKKTKRSEGVRLGMSKGDVLASSWGKPSTINKTTTTNAVHEQWVYGGGNYLYFENGILTSIQN